MRLCFESLVSLCLLVLLRLARVPAPTSCVWGPFWSVDIFYLDSLIHVHCLPSDELTDLCLLVSLQTERWPLDFSVLRAARPILFETWKLVFNHLRTRQSGLLRVLTPALFTFARRLLRAAYAMVLAEASHVSQEDRLSALTRS